MLAGLTLTTGKPRPLPRSQIPTQRTTQCGQRRRSPSRRLPGSTAGKFPVHSRHVPAPQGQQRPDLSGHGETVGPRRPQAGQT